MSLPPVIERLKRKAITSELRDYWQGILFDPRVVEIQPNAALFNDLRVRMRDCLLESSVKLAEKSVDDPYWKSAPMSQALDPVLQHFLLKELVERPGDERILWSLASLDVRHSVNEFGREYWVPLCVKDPTNLRWLVESALRVAWGTGLDTTNGLSQALREVKGHHEDLDAILHRFANGPDEGLARAARIAQDVDRGGSVFRWLP